MAKAYLPSPMDPEFEPGKEDLEYAERFRDFVNVCEKTNQSEKLILRLSTCRNSYLTQNALFVDLASIVGQGQRPSLLRSAIYYAQEGQVKPLTETLGEIRKLLSIFTEKLQVWRDRHGLDEELKRAVAACNDQVLADRINRVLSNVRTASGTNSARQQWSSAWCAISQEENTKSQERFQKLNEAKAWITGIVDGLRCVESLLTARSPKGLTLFEKVDFDADWHRFHDDLSAASELLAFRSTGANEAKELISSLLDSTVRLPYSLSTEDDWRALFPALIKHFWLLEKRVCRFLRENFRPNTSHSALPPPFKIDLTEDRPAKPTELQQGGAEANLFIRDYELPAPTEVHVGMLRVSMPKDCYDECGSYSTDGLRYDVAELVRAGIAELSKQQPAVLLLPELFIPSTHASSLAAESRKQKVVLIGGVELDRAEPQANHAIIQLPQLPDLVTQLKARNSPYEHRFRNHQPVVVLQGTEIGAFAVVLCSDFTEFDILQAIHKAPGPIDMLMVCSFNPYPDLFKPLAIADATRLYCHVVIANTGPGQGADGPYRLDAFACSPVRQPTAAGVISKSIALSNVPKTFGEATLDLFTLSITHIRDGREKERPHSGYLRCPQCRKTSELHLAN